MAIQIGAKPDGGFDDPIGMLTDCHRRILRFLDVLCHVAHRARGNALTAEEQTAVDSALRYFRESGPRHNQDEEDSLFPRLRRLETSPALDEIDRLFADHEIAAALHIEVEQLYSRWIAEGTLVIAESAQLESDTARLAHLYRDHIRIEEELVFPEAAKLFDAKAIAAMAAEFKARRA